MAQQLVRMSDIAAQLGVSTVTVSKALADKDGVGPQLRQTIKDTAAQMGYRYKQDKNAKAPSTIGIIVADRLCQPDHSFYWALYLAVVEALKQPGYYGMLEVVPQQQESSAALPDFVTQKRVDGVIVLGALQNAYLHALHGTGLPLVLLDFYCDSLDCTAVIPDNFMGGYYTTKHLIEMGHTDIGYVGSIDHNFNAQDRYYGYRKALRVHGLPFRQEWVLPDRKQNGFREEFDLPSYCPTAFFCNCDQSAYHFVWSLLKKGYLIPEDLSIAGFYDHTFSTLTRPQLTTYRISMKEMAREAVRIQMALLQGQQDVPRRIIVTGQVVQRDSVAPPPLAVRL